MHYKFLFCILVIWSLVCGLHQSVHPSNNPYILFDFWFLKEVFKIVFHIIFEVLEYFNACMHACITVIKYMNWYTSQYSVAIHRILRWNKKYMHGDIFNFLNTIIWHTMYLKWLSLTHFSWCTHSSRYMLFVLCCHLHKAVTNMFCLTIIIGI